MRHTLGTLLSRVIGVPLLVIRVAGIGFATTGVVFGRRAVGQVSVSLDQVLSLTSESLETVEATLLQAQATLSSVNELTH